MSDTDWFIRIFVTMSTVSILAGHFIPDVPGTVAIALTSTGFNPLNFVLYIWNGLAFFFTMMAFAIPGMPIILTAVWDVVAVIEGWLFLRMVRGN